jgi:hypothetical protein
MGSAARFHADHATGFHRVLDFPNPPLSPKSPAPDRLFRSVNTVKLKNMLRQIHPNACNLHRQPLLIR